MAAFARGEGDTWGLRGLSRATLPLAQEPTPITFVIDHLCGATGESFRTEGNMSHKSDDYLKNTQDALCL